jgi:hypothetical protein
MKISSPGSTASLENPCEILAKSGNFGVWASCSVYGIPSIWRFSSVAAGARRAKCIIKRVFWVINLPEQSNQPTPARGTTVSDYQYANIQPNSSEAKNFSKILSIGDSSGPHAHCAKPSEYCDILTSQEKTHAGRCVGFLGGRGEASALGQKRLLRVGDRERGTLVSHKRKLH